METQRLFLRPFAEEDAPEIFRLNGDPEVMRYLGKMEVYENVGQAEAFLEAYIKKAQTLPYSRWAVFRKADNAWLGWCGLKLNDDGRTDLGFRFHREFWGQGYATESGKAWLERGFGEFNLPKIVAQTTSGNLGSQRVIEKLGFHREPEADHEEGSFLWWNYALLRPV